MLSYGLVGGWRLDEAVGTSRADVLGRNQLTELLGTIASVSGKIGNAASFIADTHSLVSTTVLISSGSFTMACWVMWTSGGNVASPCLGQLPGATRQWVGINGSNGTPRFSVNGTVFQEGAPAAGRWTHLALSYDSTVPSFATYQDGTGLALHSVAANFAGLTGTTVGLGGSTSAAVDEAYVWNRALSETEIANLYAAGNAGLSYPWGDGKAA